MLHLITFDMNGIRMPDERAKFDAAMRACGESYVFSKTVWIIDSPMTNREITERLSPFVREADRLLVTVIDRTWVAVNIPESERDWLGSRNFAGVT